MDPLQIIGSLVAIVALAGLAAWLKLGTAPVIDSEVSARRAAQEAVDGFEPCRTGLDRAGKAAIFEDEDGRLLVLKLHGNRFAGRLLDAKASTRRDGEVLIIASGERRYGAVSLTLDNGAYWEAAVNRLSATPDA